MWTRDLAPEHIRDEASVIAAQSLARRVAKESGLPADRGEALAICVGELARNQLRYGRLGVLGVRSLERSGVPGVEIVAADRGSGLSNPEQALLGLGPESGGLGVGIPGVRRLSSELDVDVRVGEGTCIWARVFAEAVPRSPEIGIYGRSLAGQPRSGDGAMYVRTEERVRVAVVDGLGHGDPARQAADRALQALWNGRDPSLVELCMGASDACVGSRGAVLGLVEVDVAREVACGLFVGDIRGEVTRAGEGKRFISIPGTLGSRRMSHPRTATLPFSPGDSLILCSDGIHSRLDLSGEKWLLRQPAIVVAQRIVQNHARDRDDAIALVLK